jgi:hypothetical protein
MQKQTQKTIFDDFSEEMARGISAINRGIFGGISQEDIEESEEEQE